MNKKIFLIILCIFSYAAEAKDWTIHAGFEGFKDGEKALGSGGFWGGAGHTEVVKEPALRRKAAELSIIKNHTGYGKWGGEWKFPQALKKGDHVWYSVHTYFPEGFDHYSYGEGTRLKFLRIRTVDKNNQGHGHNDLYINTKGNLTPYRYIYEGEQKWVDVGYKEDLIVKNTWENYQMYIVFDDMPKDFGGMAEVMIWKNGKRLVHITNRKTLKEPDDKAIIARLFTYWNGGAPQTQSMYVDEITITNKTPTWHDKYGFPIVPFFTDSCRLP